MFARAAFVGYTALLLTATHWPGLAIKGPVSRTDLFIHVGAFGTWGVLLWLSGLVRPGVHQAARIAVVTACFGVFDEVTQPLFSRVYDPLDMGADMVGGILAGAFVAWWTLWRAKVRRMAADPAD